MDFTITTSWICRLRAAMDEPLPIRLKCTKPINLYKMHTIALSEFRARASAMIDLVEKGETVRILRHGKPVAELVPARVVAEPQHVPSWKQPIEPLDIKWPDGKSGAQMIIEERDNARF